MYISFVQIGTESNIIKLFYLQIKFYSFIKYTVVQEKYNQSKSVFISRLVAIMCYVPDSLYCTWINNIWPEEKVA